MLFTKSTVLALALSLLASALPAWSAFPPTRNFPILPRMANRTIFGDIPTTDYQKYFADAFCSPNHKLIERAAWRDALKYAQALASWQPNGAFQPAMDLYMGNDSRSRFSATLRANIDGAVRVHDLSTWPENQKVFIFCTEPTIFAELGGLCTESDFAYVFDQTGSYHENHYIVFCPRYYELKSVDATFSNFDKLPTEILQTIPAEDYVRNQGTIYFHESLHLADLTTPANHPIRDSFGDGPLIYGAYSVSKEAELENTEACLQIADAYTFAAGAVFVQQRYNLGNPPKPKPRESPLERNLGSQFSRKRLLTEQLPQLPDPNTPDNRIASNDFMIGPVTPVAQDSRQRPSDDELTPAPSFPCTPENGCQKSIAVTIATSISGPLICILIAGLCVLSFTL